MSCGMRFPFQSLMSMFSNIVARSMLISLSGIHSYRKSSLTVEAVLAREIKEPRK